MTRFDLRHRTLAPCRPEGVWATLTDELRRRGLTVRPIRGTAPTEPAASHTWPAELRELVDPSELPDDRWTVSDDLLGCFVADHDDRDLPVGIHLFAERIDRASAEEGLPREWLAWAVFWHELTHAAVDVRGLALPRPHRALQPLQWEELVCEASALHALESGRHPHTGLTGPVMPEPWRFERWRLRHPVLPYALFGHALPALEGLEVELALTSAVAFRQRAPVAFDPDAPSSARARARRLVRDVADLALGTLPVDEAVRTVSALAAQAVLSERPAADARHFAVYIWNGGHR